MNAINNKLATSREIYFESKRERERMKERTTIAKRKGINPIESGQGIWRQKPKNWSLPQNARPVLNRSPPIRRRSFDRPSDEARISNSPTFRAIVRKKDGEERERQDGSVVSANPSPPTPRPRFSKTGGPERKKRKQTNARYARDVPPTHPFYAQSRLNTRPYP